MKTSRVNKPTNLKKFKQLRWFANYVQGYALLYAENTALMRM